MQEKKKFISIIICLFAVTIVFWGLWCIRAYAWVSYKDVVVKVLGSILIGLATAMIVCGYLLFRFARPSYLMAGRKKKMLIAMGSILIVMIVNFGMLYQLKDFGYTMSQVVEILEKESEGGNYYFQIRDSEDDSIIKFSCDKKTYQLIRTDGTRYSVQYRKLTFGKKKATLGYLDVNRGVKKN
ncbi:MAG TPA: hypothetical protein DCW90_24900 [Lachnospiraceae bacterium]|nr:hypothetical protein [uncultured Lachnoclostridium sp.]HAU88593.1 hypothetical protein [Lachnospiraceae bacterium]